jgi:YVTN family beta-propeller protein
MKRANAARALIVCAIAALAVSASPQRSVLVTDLSKLLPGMPPVLDPHDIYAADRVGLLSPVVKNYPARIYVPNSESNTVDVIDPATYKVIDHFAVGRQPQHVTPSYDLKTLWVLNDLGDSVTKIDPATEKKGETLPVLDPYNMYNTPDGKFSIVVAEAQRKLDFVDPHTMKLEHALSVPCRGVDHMDFSADGRYLIASCEFSGAMLKVDVAKQSVIGELNLPRVTTKHSAKAMEHMPPSIRPGFGAPQDVKLSPDGKIFYVADMTANGVYEIDGDALSILGFIPTGEGTHGLYTSRDSKYLYISNRGEGSISVLDFASRRVVTKWELPGGGSPDMGGVSADGKILWLSGRYDSEVYAIDTSNGKLLARIKVGKQPHGLCVYPQPGRYSLGHTGIFR